MKRESVRCFSTSGLRITISGFAAICLMARFPRRYDRQYFKVLVMAEGRFYGLHLAGIVVHDHYAYGCHNISPPYYFF